MTFPIRRRWLLLVAGLVAGVELAAVVPLLRTGPAAPVRPRPIAAAGVPWLPLVNDLSQELQAGDEAAFLSHMDGTIVAGMRTWWDNLKVLGLHATAVLPDSFSESENVTDPVSVGVTIGLRSRYDADTPSTGQPLDPSSDYTLGLEAVGTPRRLVIDSWQNTAPAPWDGPPLYAHREPHVIVAGPAAERSVVDRVAPQAEDAARWLDPRLRHDTGLPRLGGGFMIFTSASQQVRDGWFESPGTPPGSFEAGGTTFALDEGVAPGFAQGGTGGARIVINPGDWGLTQTIVHEMTHAALAPLSGPGEPPAWVVEGVAHFMDLTYLSGRTPLDAVFAVFSSVLTRHFTGSPPDEAELYDHGAQRSDVAYDLAASWFVFVEQRAGEQAAVRQAVTSYGTGLVPPLATSGQLGAWARWVRTVGRG